jgi:hypothetical protein
MNQIILTCDFSFGKAIPIPITTIGMRLPPEKIGANWVVASRHVLSEVEGPEALGMVGKKE